jgi:hypothetical protein
MEFNTQKVEFSAADPGLELVISVSVKKLMMRSSNKSIHRTNTDFGFLELGSIDIVLWSSNVGAGC